jgi:hypothetical protein
MKTKAEYYQEILKNRAIAKDPSLTSCPCPKVRCEWHGKCKECVAIHRYHKDHLPECMQQYINPKLEAVVSIGELKTVPKERTSDEYRDYVIEQDKKLNNK